MRNEYLPTGTRIEQCRMQDARAEQRAAESEQVVADISARLLEREQQRQASRLRIVQEVALIVLTVAIGAAALWLLLAAPNR